MCFLGKVQQLVRRRENKREQTIPRSQKTLQCNFHVWHAENVHIVSNEHATPSAEVKLHGLLKISAVGRPSFLCSPTQRNFSTLIFRNS